MQTCCRPTHRAVCCTVRRAAFLHASCTVHGACHRCGSRPVATVATGRAGRCAAQLGRMASLRTGAHPSSVREWEWYRPHEEQARSSTCGTKSHRLRSYAQRSASMAMLHVACGVARGVAALHEEDRYDVTSPLAHVCNQPRSATPRPQAEHARICAWSRERAAASRGLQCAGADSGTWMSVRMRRNESGVSARARFCSLFCTSARSVGGAVP